MTEEKRYKGEIIAERRRNLDFSLEFSKVCMGLTAGLPKYSRKERINYYNKKISKIWESQDEKNNTKVAYQNAKKELHKIGER